MKTSDARLAALRALVRTAFGTARLDDALEAALLTLDSPRDRALARALAYGTCRFWHRLAHLRDQLLDRPLRVRDRELGVILLMGLHQLYDLRIPAHAAVNETVELTRRAGAPWAARMVNAVLRRAHREQATLSASLEADPAAALSHPPWLLDALQVHWPGQWRAIARANNQQPPMTLRVNALRGSREDYLAQLAAAGIEAHPLAHLPQGITLERAVEVEALPGFGEGAVSVQDGAAQLAAQLLPVAGGARVLDACAAPGGKTAHLRERHRGIAELVAVDRDPDRIERTRRGLERLGLADSVRCVEADARRLQDLFPAGHFDAILLDAPCSATGVIRRHPDIKLRRAPGDVAIASRLQRELLQGLWPLLARGGTLLYATCSVMPAENDQIVDAFVAESHDAEPLGIALPFGQPRGAGHQILPGDAGMDGFFYALLAKTR